MSTVTPKEPAMTPAPDTIALICRNGHRTSNPITGARGGRPWCPKCGSDMTPEADQGEPPAPKRDKLRAVAEEEADEG